MTKHKKAGFLLIVIGICLPLALLAFVSGYKDGAGFMGNLYAIKITIAFSGKSTISIPYRFILAACVTMIFVGVRILDMTRAGSKQDNDRN